MGGGGDQNANGPIRFDIVECLYQVKEKIDIGYNRLLCSTFRSPCPTLFIAQVYDLVELFLFLFCFTLLQWFLHFVFFLNGSFALVFVFLLRANRFALRVAPRP